MSDMTVAKVISNKKKFGFDCRECHTASGI